MHLIHLYVCAVLTVLLPLSSSAKELNSKVIHGELWDQDDFPELVQFKRKSNLCRAVVISKHHILTAAHCIPLYFRDYITLKLEHRGKDYQAKCRRSPWFRSRGHDLGICIVDKDPKEPFAKLSTAKIELNQTIHFLGRGCIESGEPLDKKDISVGSSEIQALTGQLHALQFSTKGRAVWCSGDSGGPAIDAAPSEGELSLIGINTRSDLEKISFFTDLRSPESIYFLSKNGFPIE